ncbi:MAG: D-alanyl-D-alanine carboxypeptidase [Ruminococcaceae bacterium]|nr:D-alanyl-D-alanine carboxypeptidase [Oscillospiraceae bacterium]
MKRIPALFLSVCLLFSSFPVWAEETPPVTVSAPAAILIEASTGQVLFEKNSHERRHPASVTKVMTMLLTMEAVDSGQIGLDDMVTCSENAASMGGSQVYLEPGEQMSVRDMLKAVAVASGNDAAVALGEHIAGTMEGFVALMNKRAEELGMADTHFVNCNGLDDPEHLTSAYDISLMSRELVKHPLILEFTGIWMDSLRDGAFGLVNTNKLIRFYEGANGLKTGSTSVAKYCISASAVRDGMNLIAVIMGAETSKERFADTSRLLDYGFANYAIAGSLLTPEELAPLAVKKGKEPFVEIGVSDDFHVLVSKTKLNSIEKHISLPEAVDAPLAVGDKVGEVEFIIDGKRIGGTDIVAKTESKRLNPFGMLAKLSKQLLFGNYHATISEPVV